MWDWLNDPIPMDVLFGQVLILASALLFLRLYRWRKIQKRASLWSTPIELWLPPAVGVCLAIFAFVAPYV